MRAGVQARREGTSISAGTRPITVSDPGLPPSPVLVHKPIEPIPIRRFQEPPEKD
jgi:hypothetical protein